MIDKQQIINSIVEAIQKLSTENQTIQIDDITNVLSESKTQMRDNGITQADIIAELVEVYKNDAKVLALLKKLNNAFVCDTKGYLQKLKADDDKKNYNCNVFMQSNNSKNIPRPIRIPRGTLSYIGAMTHRGKTTALISIALDAIEQQQKVYFITTEETSDQIFTRMIKAILYKTQKNNTCIFKQSETGRALLSEDIQDDNLDDYIAKSLKSYTGQGDLLDKTAPQSLQEAIFRSYETLNSYLKDGYFTILDHLQQRSFEELMQAINCIEKKSIVMLDYIQHVKSPKDTGVSIRQVIIQSESQALADIAGLNDLIIIAGGQFNRKSKAVETEADKYKADLLDPTLFRESGDIEQDAHLIIGIGQQQHEKPNALQETVTRFYEVLKQRGHAQDQSQYKIADYSQFSLYTCDKYKKNEFEFLTYFTEDKPAKKPKSSNTETQENKVRPRTPSITL